MLKVSVLKLEYHINQTFSKLTGHDFNFRTVFFGNF